MCNSGVPIIKHNNNNYEAHPMLNLENTIKHLGVYCRYSPLRRTEDFVFKKGKKYIMIFKMYRDNQNKKKKEK